MDKEQITLNLIYYLEKLLDETEISTSETIKAVFECELLGDFLIDGEKDFFEIDKQIRKIIKKHALVLDLICKSRCWFALSYTFCCKT